MVPLPGLPSRFQLIGINVQVCVDPPVEVQLCRDTVTCKSLESPVLIGWVEGLSQSKQVESTRDTISDTTAGVLTVHLNSQESLFSLPGVTLRLPGLIKRRSLCSCSGFWVLSSWQL